MINATAHDPAREATDLPERAELRLVSDTSEHVSRGTGQRAQAMVHLAVPGQEPGAPWRLEGLAASDPVRLRIRAEAFNGLLHVRVDEGRCEQKTLMLGDDALAARSWHREPSVY